MNNNQYDKYIALLKSNYNIVLTGAPGTGKTYLAKQIAKQITGIESDEDLKNSEQVGFVQFHPSYDYTDFVEGLRPTEPDSNGNIGFKRADGIFKSFCKRAVQNLTDSKKSAEILQKEADMNSRLENFLSSSIDNGTAYKTKTGTKFRIEDSNDKQIIIKAEVDKASDLRLNISEIIELLNNDIKLENVNDIRRYFKRRFNTQQDSYTFVICNEIRKIEASTSNSQIAKVDKKNFVFIIDEINRGEISKIFGELFFSIDPSYRGRSGLVNTQYQNLIEDGDAFKDGFYVPENVYIIGTMNDIDRSVESMDFAMRRRFTWIEITAEESQKMLDNEKWKDDAIKKMNSLNAEINKTEGLNSSYNIGAAYFKNYLKTGNSEDFKSLWDNHIGPLVKEYLRGDSELSKKIGSIKSAYNLEASKQEEAAENAES